MKRVINFATHCSESSFSTYASSCSCRRGQFPCEFSLHPRRGPRMRPSQARGREWLKHFE